MKFFITLFGLLAISLFIIFAFTSAKYSIPTMVQTLMNIKDPNREKNLDLKKIDALQQDPELCYQNEDCAMQKCGLAPNCDSFVVNKYFYKENLHGVETSYNFKTKHYSCPEYDPEETPACAVEYQLDAYAACEDNTCVIKRLKMEP
jgi:hypothetical protein